MAKQQTPHVSFQPQVYRGMQRGIGQIIEAIRPTLGPRPRLVAIEHFPRSGSPELLDDGGVIARRIIDLPGQDENTGAMFIRGMLWRLHEEVGDGTATAAVLFQSVYNQGLRYIAAGGNAMLLRRYLEKGMAGILEQLSCMTLPVEGQEQLAQVAQTVCSDPLLAKMLGEIFDIIGEYGWLDIRPGHQRGLDREYVEGSYWTGGLLSRAMIADPAKQRTEMENAAILLSDLEIEDPQQLMPALAAALQTQVHSLIIIANRLSDRALGLLASSRESEKMQVIAVKTPGPHVADQAAVLEDLAVLAGGRPFLKAAGDTLQRVKSEDFGQARRAWADPSYFGMVGGKGDPRKLREHIAMLRRSCGLADTPDAREGIRQRIGKLMGGSAILWVGGATETEISTRRELAQRTANALRGAVLEGVLCGGGVSLLACRSGLRQALEQSANPEERAACHILIEALEAPIRTLAANAGFDAGAVMAQVERAGPGFGFDMLAGQVVSLAQAGILDVATVQKEAVYSAVSSAALALTVDAVVYGRKPAYATEPD